MAVIALAGALLQHPCLVALKGEFQGCCYVRRQPAECCICRYPPLPDEILGVWGLSFRSGACQPGLVYHRHAKVLRHQEAEGVHNDMQGLWG